MALVVEDGTGKADAEAYASVADALTWYAQMGYIGTFAALGAPLVKATVASGATAISFKGGAGGETLLAGDTFRIDGKRGTYTVSEDAVADGSGDVTLVTFAPAALEAFAADDAVIFTAATEESLRRGTQQFENRYRGLLVGYRTRSAQALSFPRFGLTDADGYSVASDAVPQAVVDASLEVARVTTAARDLDTGATIKSVSAGGGAGVVFDKPKRTASAATEADRLMRQYMESGPRFALA